MKQNTNNLKIRYLQRVLVIVFIGALIWGIQWATYARPPLQEAMEALESDELVVVTQEPWLTFSPTNSKNWFYLLSWWAS